MEISNTSNANFSRTVTPSRSSSDRQTYDDSQAKNIENKALERAHEKALEQRAIQEKLQQNKEETQRRLDGRLISFGQQQDNISSQQKQASYNRSRVNEAYSAPRNEAVKQRDNTQRAENAYSDPIDIVV